MVPDFSCLSAYDHLRVIVRQSPVEVVSRRNIQWTTVPGRMLAQGLRFRLEETGRFATVRRDAKPAPPYTVEGQVQAIELTEQPRMGGSIALHLNVRRSEDGAVVGEKFVREKIDADGPTIGDGVLALRQLYARILEELSDWVIESIESDQSRPRQTR